MIGYVIVNSNDNTIKNLLSWGDQEISESYPLDIDEYIIKIDDDVYKQIQDTLISGKTFRVKDREALAFSDMFEETNLIVIEEPVIDGEKLALAEAIADLYEMNMGGTI